MKGRSWPILSPSFRMSWRKPLRVGYGSSKKAGEGIGIVLQSLEGGLIAQVIRFSFQISNNKAEYEAILLGLWLALALSVTQIEFRCDSQFVAS